MIGMRSGVWVITARGEVRSTFLGSSCGSGWRAGRRGRGRVGAGEGGRGQAQATAQRPEVTSHPPAGPRTCQFEITHHTPFTPHSFSLLNTNSSPLTNHPTQ